MSPIAGRDARRRRCAAGVGPHGLRLAARAARPPTCGTRPERRPGGPHAGRAGARAALGARHAIRHRHRGGRRSAGGDRTMICAGRCGRTGVRPSIRMKQQEGVHGDAGRDRDPRPAPRDAAAAAQEAGASSPRRVAASVCPRRAAAGAEPLRPDGERDAEEPFAGRSERRCLAAPPCRSPPARASRTPRTATPDGSATQRYIAAFGASTREPRLAQRADRRVPPPLQLGANRLDQRLGVIQRGGAGLLQRQERTRCPRTT